MVNEKILVVDDEESIREAVGEFLRREGYDFSLAENGKKALQMFQENQYAIVFMDVRMPGIDGIETFREMKKAKPETKIIIISGLPDEETLERVMAISEGTVDGFIPKPFKPDDLKKCIADVKAGSKLSAFQLTPVQMDALGKLAESGTKSVSEAFSKILKKDVEISSQKIRVVPHTQVALATRGTRDERGEPETTTVGMVIQPQGDISGVLLALFPWESGLNLVDLLGKRAIGSTKQFNDSAQSTLKTAANLIAGAYLGAITRLFGLKAMPSPPELIFEKIQTLLKSVTNKLKSQTENIFTIETTLNIQHSDITGYILLMPDIDSLKKILRALGSFGNR